MKQPYDTTTSEWATTEMIHKTCNVRSTVYADVEDGIQAFARACRNLLSVPYWNKLAGSREVVFSVIDRFGNKSLSLAKGSLLRISSFSDILRTPDNSDWMTVSDISYEESDEEECVRLEIRAIDNPMSTFSGEPDNGGAESRIFLVSRKNNSIMTRQIITRPVYNRTQRPVFESGGWRSLVEGIIE